GALFGPLQRIVAHPEQYDSQERSEAIARYCAELVKLESAFINFCNEQPGHSYAVESSKLSGALFGVRALLINDGTLEQALATHFPAARAAIESVPVPRTSLILEAGTPFTTYLQLKRLCEVDATSSVTWFDPYIAGSIFFRFLSGVR